MKLTGQEKEQLQKALLDAFTPQSLKQMLTFEFDRKLDNITTANGFSNIVFDLIDNANKEGWIIELITSAEKSIPNNTLLKETCPILLSNLQDNNRSNIDEVLSISLDCQQDLQRLQEHANFILNSIFCDINGFELNQSKYLIDITESLQNASFIEIVGQPGTGKSSFLKQLVKQQQSQGQVLVLTGNRISGKGWDDFAHSLELKSSLSEILTALSIATQPCIFIDGIDRIISEDAQLVINDLLRVVSEIQLSQNNSKQWKIIITSIEENLPEVYLWIDHRLTKNRKRVNISELSKEELDDIAKNKPYLQPLFLIKELEPIIKNLFLLNLIDKYQLIPVPNRNDKSAIQTEIGVSIIWWNSVVGKVDPFGIARKNALLEIGERIIRLKNNRIPCNGIDGNTLKSLELDRIIVREENHEFYRFSHDILENWVLYRVLEKNQHNLTSYIKENGQPLGIFRAVQLLGCFLLETDTITSWERIIKEIEQNKELTLKWRQAFLTSALISTKIENLLDKIEPFLLTNDAERLRDMLIILRTVEINTDPIWRETLLNNSQINDEPPERIAEFLLLSSIPRWKIWYQVVNWLIKKVAILPENIKFEAIKIFKLWQKKTLYGSVFRKEIAQIAFDWLEELEQQKEKEKKEIELQLATWQNSPKTDEEKLSQERAKRYLSNRGWKGFTDNTIKSEE